MSDDATSTIALLLYVKPPELNFAQIVGELDAALAERKAERRALIWDCDDVAIFDLDGTRIALGWTDGLSGPNPACLAVTVGDGPERNGCAVSPDRREAMCRVIAGRLQTRFPSDTVVWRRVGQMVTSDTLDRLFEEIQAMPLEHDDLYSTDAETAEAPEEAKPSAPVDAPVDSPADVTLDVEDAAETDADTEVFATQPQPDEATSQEVTSHDLNHVVSFQPRQDPPEVDRLLDRMAQELASRATRKERPAAVPKRAPNSRPEVQEEVANDTPDIPAIKITEMQRIRIALYPDEPEEPDLRAQPLPARLTVYSVTATIMVVSLPLGAAVLTYNLLRGEDMRVTSQAMALTGLFFGLSQSPITGPLLSAFSIG